MNHQPIPASAKDVHQTTIEWIHQRGINESQIAELTYYLFLD
ncbi:hypothetical protein [Baia soyae]|uniref:Uncharacterized protein n=1 Tax=Baia soyae TaxID=1544746 RepID=A0A4R2RMR0_9BACL|nr:hypothetical protein [Baia soyae]TCP64238.1 hypothetical protein EDD57_1423 [Baia soyae]